MATSLKELIVTYQANTKPVLDALNKIDFQIRKTSQNLTTLGSSFRGLGTELSLALSLPFALFGKSSVQALADMQSLEAGFSSVLEKFNIGLPIEEAAREELSFLKKTADELGVSFESVTRPYLQYLASSTDSLETSRKVIKSFLGVGSALGMSRAQIELMVKALQQMQSKTKISAEELKGQLGDTMPGAIKLFADAAGVGTAEFLKMMEQGQVSSKILSDVADLINKQWGASIDKGSKTIRANMNRVLNAFYQVRIEVGKGLDEFTGLNNRLGKLANWLNKVAINFRRLDDEGKKILLSFGIFVAVIGPLLVIIGTLIRLVGLAVLGFTFITGSIKFLIGIVPRLIMELRAIMMVFALNPLVAFITATLAIIYYWKEIVDLFKKAIEWISKISISGIWDKVKDFSGKITSNITNGANDAISGTTSNNSIANNQKTVNNNLTVNIPPGTSAADSSAIKNSIFAALSEQNRQSYIEVGAQ